MEYQQDSDRIATFFGTNAQALKQAGIADSNAFFDATRRSDFALAMAKSSALVLMHAGPNEVHGVYDEETHVFFRLLWPLGINLTMGGVKYWLRHHEHIKPLPFWNPRWEFLLSHYDGGRQSFVDLSQDDPERIVSKGEGYWARTDSIEKFISTELRFGEGWFVLGVEFENTQIEICAVPNGFDPVGTLGEEVALFRYDPDSEAPLSDIRKALLLKGYKLGSDSDLVELGAEPEQSYLVNGQEGHAVVRSSGCIWQKLAPVDKPDIEDSLAVVARKLHTSDNKHYFEHPNRTNQED